MKKIFTLLSVVMLFVLTANAAGDNYRRTWDFREGWSATTLEIMAQDTKHWTVQGTGFQNTGSFNDLTAVMTYNGEDILVPELEGLTLGGMKNAAHVQIHTGKAGTENPADAPCLWINGKNNYDYIEFTVPAGEGVKIGYCSHSNSQARGFKVSSGFADADGNTTFTSIADGTIVDVELINSNAEESRLKLSSTSGHHIYYIIIGEGDVPQQTKVGYLYSGASFEELPLYGMIKDIPLTTYEGINVDATVPTKEALMAYDAVVIDGGVAATDALVSFLKENIYWQPVVNFSGKVAEALGFGEAIEVNNEIAWAVDMNHKWFKGFESFDTEDGMFAATGGNILPAALTLTGHAGEDAVISWGTETEAHKDSVIAYAYNSGHNAYIYYGIAGDYSEVTSSIITNIVTDAIDSKAEVTATPKPAFTGIYKQQQTLVVLSCLNKNATIYYTIDGSEPTLSSTVYTGDTLEFTKEAVINAIAVANGYTISEMNSFEVKLFNQAKMPTITTSGNETKGDVIVTLSSEEEGVDIWYNFSGSADTLKSSKYVGPITLKRKAEITTFALSEALALVQSELATADIKVNMLNVRRDELAHFSTKDAGYDKIENFTYDGVEQTAWANTSKYYFSWGKTAAASFTNGDPIVDENGDAMFDETGNPMFEKTENPVSVAQNINDPNWSLTSQGQVMIYQTNTLSENIGNFGGYNPERSEDFIEKWGTGGDIQFGGVASGDKCTAAIRTNVKFAGPFNVIAVVANVNGNKTTGEGKPAKIGVQISKDGNTWEMVGDTLVTASIMRNYKTFEVSYDGTEEVYVRLASVSGSSQSVHDIYILNNGEKSKAEEANYTAGIEDIVAPEFAPVKARKVIKDGKLLIVTAKGIYNLTGVQMK